MRQRFPALCYKLTSYGNFAVIKIPYFEQDSVVYDHGNIGDISVTNFISADNDSFLNIRIGDPADAGGRYDILSVTYSDIWDTTTETNHYNIALFIGTGVLNYDPLIEDASAPDFRLRESSPCIDPGMNTDAVRYGAVTDEYDGMTRSSGPAYGMGAYELSQSMVK